MKFLCKSSSRHNDNYTSIILVTFAQNGLHKYIRSASIFSQWAKTILKYSDMVSLFVSVDILNQLFSLAMSTS